MSHNYPSPPFSIIIGSASPDLISTRSPTLSMTSSVQEIGERTFQSNIASSPGSYTSQATTITMSPYDSISQFAQRIPESSTSIQFTQISNQPRISTAGLPIARRTAYLPSTELWSLRRNLFESLQKN